MAGKCVIREKHCESCGNTDAYDLDTGMDEDYQGYTRCCNELVSYGPEQCRNHHGDR